MNDKHEQFKQVLDDHHQWPCPYAFKFIVPTENLPLFQKTFPEAELQTRESKTGKYTSVTMESNMCSSKDVMAIYEKAAEIPGIMSL